MRLFACAKIMGNIVFPDLYGFADFYTDHSSGVWIAIKVGCRMR